MNYVKRLHRRLHTRKTSKVEHYIILYVYKSRGSPGSRGGSVINEDTSPGPV